MLAGHSTNLDEMITFVSFFPSTLLIALLLSSFTASASSYPEIEKHISIYEKRDAYSAWPAIARAIVYKLSSATSSD